MLTSLGGRADNYSHVRPRKDRRRAASSPCADPWRDSDVAIESLECKLRASGGVDGDAWVVLSRSSVNKGFACSGARTGHPENVAP